MRIAIGVMARAPSAPGKTRLAGDVSEPRLRALREAMLVDTLSVVCSVPHTAVSVFVTPSAADGEIGALAPKAIRVRPQVGDDLGARMRNAIAALIEHDGNDAAILVGTDAPLITVDHFDEAITLLRIRGGVVIGPADDGGYYLIGMTRVFDPMFDGIAWGTDAVLMDTLRITDQLHIDACLIRGAYDVDTVDDLRRLARDLAVEPTEVAPRTRQVLSDF